MRVPGRVHITWQDENTLKIETDAGTQTRVLRFGDAPPPAGEPGWQGYSAATWEIAGAHPATAGVVLEAGAAGAVEVAAAVGGGARGGPARRDSAR